jgi:hypothetical protein
LQGMCQAPSTRRPAASFREDALWSKIAAGLQKSGSIQ